MQNKYAVESVDNALQLLLMLQGDGIVRLSEAARELGVARSTVHRLLGTLTARGFAVQDEHRRYLPGPSLTATPDPQGAAPGRLRLVAHRHLRNLSRESGETVHLMVREGTKVRFLDSVEASQALRIGSRIGVLLPAHTTAGGKALLADLERDEVERLYRTELEGPDLVRLVRSLAAVRQRGFGTNVGQTERGVTAVGVRVRDAGGRPIAAMTISAPSLRVPRAAVTGMAAVLLEAVARLEGELARGTGG